MLGMLGMLNAILEFCESQRDWAVETIDTLARLESPTADKRAVDECGQELRRRLAAMGGRGEELPREQTGDHLLVEFGSGTRQVLILGHFDTVWPVGQIGRMPIKRENGRLYGPGVFDMKGGIAIGMLATRALCEVGPPLRRRVVMLWTADEERGSVSSREVIAEQARLSAAVLVLEPSGPGGALKTSRKGCGEYELVAKGRAAHAGVDPAKGASAVHELARQIVALEALQDLERGISVNVGVIGGGTRPNVVAEHASAIIDVRAPTLADASRVDEVLRTLRARADGVSIHIRGGFDRPPLERSSSVARLYELARAVAADLGRELGEGSSGGGSDGNLTAALGVPTLDGLGAVGEGPHALHEHIEIDAIPWRAALVAGLLTRLDEAT